ncbi:hypothetical protein [Acinetobacter sp.]|uniref:hypothetical protein n=1 Tax=Acinetobacter sp. TaxID=472 RepID=UPI0035B4E794
MNTQVKVIVSSKNSSNSDKIAKRHKSVGFLAGLFISTSDKKQNGSSANKCA